jgi:hypothetical protein
MAHGLTFAETALAATRRGPMSFSLFTLPRFARRPLSPGSARGARNGRSDKGGRGEPPAAEAGEVELPAIIVRAQDELRCTRALSRLGYRKVRAEYARHRRFGRGTFLALADAGLWPSMEFVRAWLRAERRRILARTVSSFLVALLVTIIAGLAFAGTLAFLSWLS